jgi:uncharacterized protein
MIFVDSGAWYASLIPLDPDHAAAQAWLRQNNEPLLTTDFIMDETLTLLRARGQNQKASKLGSAFLDGSAATLYCIAMDDLYEAMEVFQRFADKEWSFTDCTSKVVIEKLELATAFSFDHHFRQFGTVQVVP